jgi:hypothetical protein
MLLCAVPVREGSDAITSIETTRIHDAAWRGGNVAARGARAADGDDLRSMPCYSGPQCLVRFFESEQLMRDNELRGIILEALYNQRRKDSVDFEAELGKLPLPDGAMESIVRQLEKKGLIERPFRTLTGLGKGRITAYGIEVVEGTTSPPLSILFQHFTTQVSSDVQQDSSDIQIGTGNMQEVSAIMKMNTATEHSQPSQDAPNSFFEKISKLALRILKKFGLNV